MLLTRHFPDFQWIKACKAVVFYLWDVPMKEGFPQAVAHGRMGLLLRLCPHPLPLKPTPLLLD